MGAATEDKVYSSPDYKLLAFFEKSRNRWKCKALERKQQIRRLEKRIVELETSRQKWRAKAQTPAGPVVHDEQPPQKRT